MKVASLRTLLTETVNLSMFVDILLTGIYK